MKVKNVTGVRISLSIPGRKSLAHVQQGQVLELSESDLEGLAELHAYGKGGALDKMLVAVKEEKSETPAEKKSKSKEK